MLSYICGIFFHVQVEEAKQELQEVVEFLKNPHKFTVLGGKLPKGKNCCSAEVKNLCSHGCGACSVLNDYFTA